MMTVATTNPSAAATLRAACAMPCVIDAVVFGLTM
jgi:hypothetical protein